MDAINLGIEHHQAGRLVEAEAIYRQILQSDPNHPDALHWLGVIAHQMGEDEHASDLIKQAIILNNIKVASYYCHLGMVYKQLKKYAEAIEVFQQAITLNPDHAETYNNIGNVFQTQCELDKAMDCYQKALAINPNLVEAYNNIGDILKIQGNLENASICYQNTKLIAPNSFSGYNAALGLTVLHYLNNNLLSARVELEHAKGLFGGISRASVASQIYCRYMDFLLTWWESNQINVSSELDTLYVIGESHSLSLQNINVSVNGKQYHCESKWIEGCKQWHIANNTNNIYKYQVTQLLETLPINSTVLFTIGEIDCRYNEGIFPLCNKTGKNIQEIIDATVKPYLNYICNLAKPRGINLIISGIPASNVTINELSQDEIKRFGLFLETFNSVLKQETLNRGIIFLNVFDLTNAQNGFADGKYHLDSHHLRPDSMQTAFIKHLVN